MGCGCGGRRQNTVAGIRAVARGDVRTAIAEAKDFTRTAARDVRRLVNGGRTMATYKALKRFYQNTVWYEVDQVFELAEADADHLLEGGIIAEEPAAPLKTKAAA